MKGNALEGRASGEKFGYAVAMSLDGNVIAVGAPNCNHEEFGENTGEVRVYKYEAANWELVETITGKIANSEFGYSISLSSDGNTILVGAPKREYVQIHYFSHFESPTPAVRIKSSSSLKCSFT